MKTLVAIETNYAGCRFRSRLEARWAVMFDSLGVDWVYEPQGYTVGPNSTPYLPDFYLPMAKLWVEVKGRLEPAELETLTWAAGPAGLPLDPSGERALDLFPHAERLLLLGDIPPHGDAWLHTRLDALSHDLVVAQPCVLEPAGSGGLRTVEIGHWTALNPVLTGQAPAAGDLKALAHGFACPAWSQSKRVSDAYRAARSARFEHGESGAA